MLKTQQRGAVLIVSLIILLIMTLLGVTSMRSTSLDERMAGNARDHHLAFEAAEAALVHAEGALLAGAGQTGTYADVAAIIWNGNDVIQADSLGDTNGPIATAPKYVIQQLTDVTTDTGDMYTLYRITARGSGGSDNSVVFLQTVYAVATIGSSGRHSWREIVL